jgi:hypothetical protein
MWNGVCGDSEHVDESVVSEYKPKLLELISPVQYTFPAINIIAHA